MGDTLNEMTCVPEVQTIFAGKNDKFIILGTDGLWEGISNQEAGELVLPFYEKSDPEMAANELVKEAFRGWRKKSLIMVDDITAIIIFLKPKFE
jgi:serine/threonine protein phosphatase PrpC